MLSKCAISNINTEILTEISTKKYQDRNRWNINRNMKIEINRISTKISTEKRSKWSSWNVREQDRAIKQITIGQGRAKSRDQI